MSEFQSPGVSVSGQVAKLWTGMRGRFSPARLSWPMRLGAAALVAAATWVAFGPDLRLLLQSRPRPAAEVVQAFNAPSLPPGVTVRGFQHCAGGWCLAPDNTGELLYDTGTSPLAWGVNVSVWMPLSPGTTNRLAVSTDSGRSFTTIAENVNAIDKCYTFDLPPGHASVLLKIEARNQSPNQVLCVDQLILRPFIGARSVPPFRPVQVVAGLAGLGLCLVLLSKRPGWTLLVVAVVCVGAWLRLHYLLQLMPSALEPDAEGYALYARTFSLFGTNSLYSAHFGMREPLFVFLTHYFFLLVGDSDYHLRVFTFVLSLVLIVAVIRFGRARLGPLGGLAMGLVIALNGPLARESARGLRLEAETLLWLGFLWVGFLATRPTGWPKAALLGVLGGLASLIRTTYLPVVVVLGVVAFAARPKAGARWVRYAAVAAAVPVLLMLPHRYALYRVHGDPFYDTAIYARWNANFEFAGQPGYPTIEQALVNPLVGPRLTYGEYLFGLHTVPQVVVGTARGYAKMYGQMRSSFGPLRISRTLFAFTVGLQLLGLIGFVLAAFSARDRWLPFAFLLSEWASAFLYDRGLVETYRHTYHAYPLFLMAAFLALSAILARGKVLWGAWRHDPVPEVGQT